VTALNGSCLSCFSRCSVNRSAQARALVGSMTWAILTASMASRFKVAAGPMLARRAREKPLGAERQPPQRLQRSRDHLRSFPEAAPGRCVLPLSSGARLVLLSLTSPRAAPVPSRTSAATDRSTGCSPLPADSMVIPSISQLPSPQARLRFGATLGRLDGARRLEQ